MPFDPNAGRRYASLFSPKLAGRGLRVNSRSPFVSGFRFADPPETKRGLDDPKPSIARPMVSLRGGNHVVIENRKETTMSITVTKSQAKEPANPPVAKVRVGLITASIWERSAEKGKYHTVSFERRYRNKQGNWQTAHTFDPADLLALAKVADLAHTRVLELRTSSDE